MVSDCGMGFVFVLLKNRLCDIRSTTRRMSSTRKRQEEVSAAPLLRFVLAFCARPRRVSPAHWLDFLSASLTPARCSGARTQQAAPRRSPRRRLHASCPSRRGGRSRRRVLSRSNRREALLEANPSPTPAPLNVPKVGNNFKKRRQFLTIPFTRNLLVKFVCCLFLFVLCLLLFVGFFSFF